MGALIAIIVYGLPLRLLEPSRAAVLRSLSWSMLAVGLFGPWLFVLSNYILLGHFVPEPTRYGLAVVAVALALLAVAVRGRVEELGLACAVLVVLSVDLVPQLW